MISLCRRTYRAMTLAISGCGRVTTCPPTGPETKLENLEGRVLLATYLPGMHLVDASADHFDGQVIYLDFDGAKDVTYRGPVQVGPFDVPAYQAPAGMEGQEQTIEAAVLREVQVTFAESGVQFTLIRPEAGTEYSTVYIGGDDSAFRFYGQFNGLAEDVDAGNHNHADSAFVFSAGIGRPPQLSYAIVHEAGHILGFGHDTANRSGTKLSLVALQTDGFDYPVGKPNGSGYNPAVGNTTSNGWKFLEPTVGQTNVVYHPGQDWNGNDGGDSDFGDPVYAVANGTIVAAANYGSGWGNIILIRHDLPSGETVWSNYAHLQSMYVTSGSVARGQQIGTIGKGYNNEYWAHLHCEIRKTDRAANAYVTGMTSSQVQSLYYSPVDFISSHRPSAVVAPDLTITAGTISPSPSTVSNAAVRTITVNYTLQNLGGAAPQSQTKIALVNPSNVSQVLNSVTFTEAAIAASSSSSRSGTITVPAGAAAGSYQVRLYVDNQSDIGQTVINNDIVAGPNITVTSPVVAPDLTITAGTISPSPSTVSNAAVRTITVNYTLQNLGGAAPQSQTKIALVNPSNVSQVLNSVTFTEAAIAASSSSSRSGTITVPAGAAAGSYQVRLYVDNQSDIGQTVINNDIVAGPNITVTSPVVAPDLTITAGTISPSPSTVSNAAVRTITVNYTLQNLGGAAPQSQTKIALVNPSNVSQVLNSVTFTEAAIAASSSSSRSGTITVPAGAAAGSYQVRLYVDNQSDIGQTVINNDIVAGPNITVSTLADTPDYPSATWIGGVPGSNYGIASRTAFDIKWIVIHTTESTAASAISWFQNAASEVSTHYIVKRDGTVVQLVHDKDIAYHAGNLPYNQQSIGIEHERYSGADCTPAQYSASAALVGWLTSEYDVELAFPDGVAPAGVADGSGIIGHNQVPDPSNPALGGGISHHTDPTNWNWSTYEGLFSIANSAPTSPTNNLPAGGSTATSLVPTLSASAFSDPDEGDTHASSQWIVKRSSDDAVVFDSGEDAANRTSCSIPAGRLASGTNYTWQVRYKDNRDLWSDYSTPTSFTTESQSDTLTLQPDGVAGQDVWVTNFYYDGGVDNEKLGVGGWGDWYYSLLRFDLTEMPMSATSAVIYLHTLPSTGSSTPTTMTLMRVNENWNESTKWAGQPSVTQIASLPAAPHDAWYSIDVTSLYNAWQAGVYPNYGIELRPTHNNNNTCEFYSSDYTADVTLRPKLVVTSPQSQAEMLIDGTSGDDDISASLNGTKLRVMLNGILAEERELALVSRLTINGLAGDDTITMASSVEVPALIYGGDGNDSITGGSGADTIYGNFGNDVIAGGLKRDSILAGLGNDTVTAGDGPDSIYGGDGTDLLRGGKGADYIEGRGKADTIYGGFGNDAIIGGAGADLIYGEDDDDRIDVSPAWVFRDTVDGGLGNDLATYDDDDVVMGVEGLLA